jgi:hypothetical protein
MGGEDVLHRRIPFVLGLSRADILDELDIRGGRHGLPKAFLAPLRHRRTGKTAKADQLGTSRRSLGGSA